MSAGSQRRAIMHQRWGQQRKRCIWCGEETWCNNHRFARQEFSDRMWMMTKVHISDKEIDMKQATVEHLIPKSRGGSDKPSNIAMACLGCNTSRQKLGGYLPCPDVVVPGFLKPALLKVIVAHTKFRTVRLKNLDAVK